MAKTKLESRIASVPQHVMRLEEARLRLDSVLAGFHSRDNCDALIAELRRDAQSRGLSDVTVDPDLECLLDNPLGLGDPLRLDTILVDFTARGRFTTLGPWLDALENRGDFRYWISCSWKAGGDESVVAFTGRAAVVVVRRTEPIAETDATG
jgi:hypothetical protein